MDLEKEIKICKEGINHCAKAIAGEISIPFGFTSEFYMSLLEGYISNLKILQNQFSKIEVKNNG